MIDETGRMMILRAASFLSSKGDDMPLDPASNLDREVQKRIAGRLFRLTRASHQMHMKYTLIGGYDEDEINGSLWWISVKMEQPYINADNFTFGGDTDRMKADMTILKMFEGEWLES